jgi:hypothetical protein
MVDDHPLSNCMFTSYVIKYFSIQMGVVEIDLCILGDASDRMGDAGGQLDYESMESDTDDDSPGHLILP